MTNGQGAKSLRSNVALVVFLYGAYQLLYGAFLLLKPGASTPSYSVGAITNLFDCDGVLSRILKWFRSRPTKPSINPADQESKMAKAWQEVTKSSKQDIDDAKRCGWCSVPRDGGGEMYRGRWFCDPCTSKWNAKKEEKIIRLARNIYPHRVLPKDGEFHSIPNFFSPDEADQIYGALLSELKILEGRTITWSAHHKVEAPEQSKTFMEVVKKISDYFFVLPVVTRCNFFTSGEEWKPFHHDSHIMDEDSGLQENFTVGVSFGADRDFALLDPTSRRELLIECRSGDLFAFDTKFNNSMQHGVKPCKLNGGRISLVVWANREMHPEYKDAVAGKIPHGDNPRPPLATTTKAETQVNML